MTTQDGYLFLLLQESVAESKNERQQGTGITHRAMFLVTETAEVVREILKLDGLYGQAAAQDAKTRLAAEMCDVIWNVCDLATQLGIKLDAPMAALLRKNVNRTWEEK